MAVESAIADHLGQVAAGRPYRLTATRMQTTIGARPLNLEFSSPLAKVDPAMDSAAAVREALQSAGLTSPSEIGPLGGTGTLAGLSKRLGLDAASEDCLRRVVTYGRAPAARTDVSIRDAAGSRSVRPGDQLDVRASVAAPIGERVLWTRVRFTGDAKGRWLVHDYRLLSTSSPAPCRSAD